MKFSTALSGSVAGPPCLDLREQIGADREQDRSKAAEDLAVGHNAEHEPHVSAGISSG